MIKKNCVYCMEQTLDFDSNVGDVKCSSCGRWEKGILISYKDRLKLTVEPVVGEPFPYLLQLNYHPDNDLLLLFACRTYINEDGDLALDDADGYDLNYHFTDDETSDWKIKTTPDNDMPTQFRAWSNDLTPLGWLPERIVEKLNQESNYKLPNYEDVN